MMRAALPLLFVVGCHSSAARDSVPQVKQAIVEESERDGLVTKRAICFSGASLHEDPYTAGGNRELGEICEGLVNVIRGKRYPFFTWQEDGAIEAVIRVMDTNHDGKVTLEDEASEITIIGFSWGGFNAVALAKEIQGSALIESRRRKSVERLIVLDPYKPQVFSSELSVPSNVRHFWELRHTVAPASDCSRNAPLGPYRGVDPVCSTRTQCSDHDYSLAPNDRFAGIPGRDVGHCTVPMITSAIIRDLTDHNETNEPLPPKRDVKRRN
jgi:pimeloyl-ACP methyl ester carboxylesterase